MIINNKFITLAFSVLLIATHATSGQADNVTPKVFDKTIGNWGFAWWQWALNFPFTGNPMLVDGNVNCTAGQTGKVWFLAGNWSGGLGEKNPAVRKCTIQKEKAIFFPIFNTIKWTPLNPTIPEDCVDEKSCRNAASDGTDPLSSWTCTVDGMPCVWFAQIVRAQSDAKAINILPKTFAADLGYVPGVRKLSISDGYWAMLDPLLPGQHKIHFTANAPGGFGLDVTYDLTVK